MKNNSSSKEKQKNKKINQQNNTLQNDKYNQMLLAMEEEDILMEKIETFIVKHQTDPNLEELIKKNYLQSLEKTKTDTQKAIREWRKSIKDEISKIEKLINEDLKEEG